MATRPCSIDVEASAGKPITSPAEGACARRRAPGVALLFDQGDFLAEVGGLGRPFLASGPGSDHDQVVVHAAILPILRDRGKS